jgi:hypothetical protein
MVHPVGLYYADYGYYLMFVVPYILVTHAFIQFQLGVLYASFLSWKILISTCFGCYLHPSSGAQLQCTAIGFYGFGVLYSIEQVLVLGHFGTLARSVIDQSIRCTYSWNLIKPYGYYLQLFHFLTQAIRSMKLLYVPSALILRNSIWPSQYYWHVFVSIC